MGPAALQAPGDAGHGSHRSRGTAAIIALAVHIGLLIFLVDSLGRVFIPEPPAIAPMLVRLIDQPRGPHQDSDRLALRPRFINPTPRLADTPPSVRVEVPTEVPPAPVPAEVFASLVAGHKDVEADGSPRGRTEGVDQGAGLGILHQVAPTYSAASVRAHEQGTVTLKVLVNAQGAPTQISLAGSSGFPRLDQSAAEAVRHYRFSPPSREVQARGSWTMVKVEFDLLRMPVPTSIVAFDSAIAEQIAAATRTKPALRLDVLKITPRVSRLAGNLLDSLVSGPESAPQRSPSAATPMQQLARQGKLRSVRFIGLASNGFDCGTATPPSDPRDARCEIFEVQQTSGTSYWLALLGDDGTRFENVAIASSVNGLSAVNLSH